MSETLVGKFELNTNCSPKNTVFNVPFSQSLVSVLRFHGPE